MRQSATYIIKPVAILILLLSVLTRLEAQIVDTTSSNVAPDCVANKEDNIFRKVGIIAAFPGGWSRWNNFAGKNFDFNYVEDHLPDSVKQYEDSVLLEFVVTKEGKLCNIRLVEGSALLAKPAMQLLQKSPLWNPAVVSSGRQVNSYRRLRLHVVVNADISMLITNGWDYYIYFD